MTIVYKDKGNTNKFMDKKRIAILFCGNIYNLRGEFTAIHNRVKEFRKNDILDVDVYVFGEYFDKFTRMIKRINQPELRRTIEIDGVKYNCLWYQRSHLDYITHKLFKHKTAIEINRVRRTAQLFKDYSLIYANSLYTAYIGLDLKRKYNIPFICMWHGSSIHTAPFGDKNVFKYTKEILENADMNLFVSDELLTTAKRITNKFKGEISYNGIDTERFCCLTDAEREALRKEKGITKDEKCVAFVGNCLPIKNVQYLPELFSRISETVNNVHFFIVGNGAFAPLFANRDINITYANEIKNEDMPQWYNCMDLIVMPSINEGLPMTCLEATACGTQFVGSRVGAIADVVGVENTVPHNGKFNNDFAELSIKCLTNIKIASLPQKFNLKNIIDKEIEIINSL